MTAPASDFLTTAEFAAHMAGLGGFERRPRLAVAVSGGADSLALCLLAAGWARRRRGAVTALVVDHGLRPEAAAEGDRVAAWLDRRRIPTRRLAWRGRKPETAIQEAARAARYRLMGDWCHAHGVLHLLLGHHRDDQAETLLMRLARGSGPDGLAAMSAVVETASLRLLRPLLGIDPERLRETLRRRGQAWIEDPSNRDPRFLRGRLRAAGPALAEAGVTAAGLAEAAARLGNARQALEAATVGLLARACRLEAAGFARLDREPLAAAAAELAQRALGRVLACVGGAVHPPASSKVARLLGAVNDGAGSHTLGGCRVVAEGGSIVVCREGRHAAAAVDVRGGRSAPWDDRFLVTAAPALGRRRLQVARLGRRDWSGLVAERPDLRQTTVPSPARPTLPALRDAAGVVAVPHLGYVRQGAGAVAAHVDIAFRPRLALSPVGFFLA